MTHSGPHARPNRHHPVGLLHQLNFLKGLDAVEFASAVEAPGPVVVDQPGRPETDHRAASLSRMPNPVHQRST